MKITSKIISLLLAVIMLCGCLTGLSVLTVSAADTTTSGSSSGTAEAPGEETKTMDYLTELFATPDDKLATMDEMYKKGNYIIYADERSGEVAVKDTVTGQVMFTNPYDVASANSTENIKSQLMSQIVVTYEDATSGKESVFYSYEQAALNNQITVKNIRGGIRVEYTIGREQARRLVPQWIEQTRFEELLLRPMREYYDNDENNFYYKKFRNWYTFRCLDECATDRLKKDMLETYPCTANMNIYTFDPTANDVEKAKEEEKIKAACPDYSYEEMDFDHQLTGYQAVDENPPVFKMALEYTINEDGFSVRLPANGIRFNQTQYQLDNIQVLPFMGAGNNAYTGYTFYPDGSGALFAFEDLLDEDTYTVSGEMYGTDYAYHTLTGGAYQQDVYYPVFGLVENVRYYDIVGENAAGEATVTRLSGAVYDQLLKDREENKIDSAIYRKYSSLLSGNAEVIESKEDRGYLAIIEEGDALAQLTYSHDGVLSPYDTVKMSFNPRPKDSYNLADSISVGTNSEWTVVSSRKYVGSYRIRYIMLTDEHIAAEKATSQPDTWEWYSAEWMGMAEAYRDYLLDRGVLTALHEGVADSDLKDIPLYVETFGSTETTEKILSVPVTVDKALTSFEDVKTMYVELLASQVTNINFKLTGYYNGGLYASMPYKLNWEKVVSKKTDFQELLNFAAEIKAGNYDNLLAYAKEILSDADYAALETYVKDPASKAGITASLGIFPDFEFSYTNGDEWFDGLDLRKHAVKTIDDRYTSKRVYSATQQKYIGYYQLAISPAYYSHFYEKLMSNYKEYENVTGISVGSLGNALNSDFDEDEPYNREDSKSFITKALSYFSDNDLEVMVDGGNAYTWRFVDHILNAPLDSSRYILASYSVPFLGVVLHGYVDFTGSPLNMEGNVAYATLKAIENGASLYFTLSYQNTQVLKEDELYSRYYSIRYDIWREDVVEIYNELNTDLKDVQNDIIMDHQFLPGTRVPDSDELLHDVNSIYQGILDDQDAKEKYEAQMKTDAEADARRKIESLPKATADFIETCLYYYSGTNGAANQYAMANNNFQTRVAAYMEADAVYKDLVSRYRAAAEIQNPTAEQKAELTKLSRLLATAESDRNVKLGRVRTALTSVLKAINTIETAYESLTQLYRDAQNGKLLLSAAEGLPASIMVQVEACLAEAEALMDEQLGLTFDQTVEKLSMDTFFQAHIANLVLHAYGTDSADVAGVVGKAENLYELLATGSYGVTADEVELFRSLEANRGLTDEELIAKYELTETPSMKALITFAKELLGDNYTFDPLLTEEQIDANITEYFLYLLKTKINTLTTASVVPGFNAVTTKKDDKGETVIDEVAVEKLNEADAIIRGALTSNDALLDTITDGNYRLYDHFTEAQMDALVAEVVAMLEGVIYNDPAALESDIRARAEGMYYKAAIAKAYATPKKAVTLHVATTTYTTEDSLELLYSMTTVNYANTEGVDVNELMKQAYLALLGDTAAFEAIDRLAANESLQAYGQLFNAEYLTLGYYSIFAEEMAALAGAYKLNFNVNDKLDALNAMQGKNSDLNTTIKNITAALKSADYVASLREVTVLKAKTSYAKLSDELKQAVDALEAALTVARDLAEAVDTTISRALAGKTLMTVEELQAIIDTVSEMIKGVTVTGSVTNYVYLAYYNRLANTYVPRFYYEDEMIEMDVAVQGKALVKSEELKAQLTDDATAYDVYELLLAAMADRNDSITAFVTAVNNNLDHYPVTGTTSLYQDVMNHYSYVLYHAFDEVFLTLGEPVIPFINNGSTFNNAMTMLKAQTNTRVDELMVNARINTETGEFADYSLGAQLTDEELTLLVEGIFQTLVDADFIDVSIPKDTPEEDKAAAKEAKLQEMKDRFMPALTEYFLNEYYNKVAETIGANARINFKVSQVYATPEGEDIGFRQLAANLKELMYHYITTFTDLSVEDLEQDSTQQDGTQNDSQGKYTSDDGRIVAVTYGDDTDGDGVYEATKTFILNYNKFSVRVKYSADGDPANAVLYTIPAYGYVVVSYDHGN